MNIPYIKNLQSGATVHPVNRSFSASGEQTHTDTKKNTDIRELYDSTFFNTVSSAVLFGLGFLLFRRRFFFFSFVFIFNIGDSDKQCDDSYKRG